MTTASLKDLFKGTLKQSEYFPRTNTLYHSNSLAVKVSKIVFPIFIVSFLALVLRDGIDIVFHKRHYQQLSNTENFKARSVKLLSKYGPTLLALGALGAVSYFAYKFLNTKTVESVAKKALSELKGKIPSNPANIPDFPTLPNSTKTVTNITQFVSKTISNVPNLKTSTDVAGFLPLFNLPEKATNITKTLVDSVTKTPNLRTSLDVSSVNEGFKIISWLLLAPFAVAFCGGAIVLLRSKHSSQNDFGLARSGLPEHLQDNSPPESPIQASSPLTATLESVPQQISDQESSPTDGIFDHLINSEIFFKPPSDELQIRDHIINGDKGPPQSNSWVMVPECSEQKTSNPFTVQTAAEFNKQLDYHDSNKITYKGIVNSKEFEKIFSSYSSAHEIYKQLYLDYKRLNIHFRTGTSSKYHQYKKPYNLLRAFGLPKKSTKVNLKKHKKALMLLILALQSSGGVGSEILLCDLGLRDALMSENIQVTIKGESGKKEDTLLVSEVTFNREQNECVLIFKNRYEFCSLISGKSIARIPFTTIFDLSKKEISYEWNVEKIR